jgi:diacylglycerol kinase
MKKIIKSFKYAFSGIIKAFSAGRNFKIMSACFLLVIVFGFLFNVTAAEWTILLICSGLVLSLEMINTAIEKAIDIVEPGYSQKVKTVKDLAAGAVLVFSIASAAVALIIFLPYIAGIFRS